MTYRCGLPEGHKSPHGPVGGLVRQVETPAVPWREGGIWLRHDGVAYVVAIERDGKWIDVIRDMGACSHIVEPLGINDRIARATHPTRGDSGG